MTTPRDPARRPATPATLTALAGLAALATVLALVGAGCFGGSDNTATTTTGPPTTSTPGTTTEPAATRSVRIYLVRDGKLTAEGREVPATPAVGSAALKALLGDRPFELTVANGVATVTGTGTLSAEGLAEIVATLTQFPTVQSVEIDGKRLTRLDIEELTPSILLESPLPGAHVASPVRLSGTANTFEATFLVEVLDRDGKSLSRRVVTATSGSGTRGTFDTDIGFDIIDAQPGTIYAYEASARDGRPIHQVRVPVTLEP